LIRFQKQRPTTCRIDLHSFAAGFQRSDISHFTKRIKMIEAVKIITLEGTISDKDFHAAPRICSAYGLSKFKNTSQDNHVKPS